MLEARHWHQRSASRLFAKVVVHSENFSLKNARTIEMREGDLRDNVRI